MPSFDLATGYVTFKGSFDQYEADIQKAREKVENLNKSISSGKFEMAARESKRINDEMAKASRNAKRIMDELQLGKMGVFMRDFNAGLNKFAATAGKFGAGATGIGGAALAAGAGGSPLAKSTLQGSFDLLMTEIGGTFTPLVKDVSKGLQDVRMIWKGMSSEMKSFLNEGAKFIGVAGLAALGLAAVAKGFSLIAAHPLIAVLSGGIGILSAQEAALKRKDAEITGAKEIISGTTAEDAAKGWQGQRLAGMKPDEAKVEAERLFKQNWQRYEDVRRGHEYMTTGLRGMLTPQKEQDEQAQRVVNVGREFEESKFNLEKFGNVKLPRKEGAGKNDAGMLLGSMGPASMTDIQGLFKSFQMAGAGGNQLEAEIKKEELKNQQDFVKAQVKVIVDAIEKKPIVKP